MGSLCLLIAKVAFHRQSSRSDRYLAPPAIVILGRLATLASRRRRPETFPRLRSPLAARSSCSERTRRERKQRGNNFPLSPRVRSPASRARRLDASFTLQPWHRSRPGRREDGCLIVRHPTRTARVVPRRRRDVRTGRPVEKNSYTYLGDRGRGGSRRKGEHGGTSNE